MEQEIKRSKVRWKEDSKSNGYKFSSTFTTTLQRSQSYVVRCCSEAHTNQIENMWICKPFLRTTPLNLDQRDTEKGWLRTRDVQTTRRNDAWGEKGSMFICIDSAIILVYMSRTDISTSIIEPEYIYWQIESKRVWMLHVRQ